MTDTFTITALSENSLLVSFGNIIDVAINKKIVALAALINAQPFAGLIETVPSYSSLAVFYHVGIVLSKNKNGTAFEWVSNYLTQLLNCDLSDRKEGSSKLIEVPVLYDGEDLASVSSAHCQSNEETIRIHTSRPYRVFMIGFLPGFAYMGTLDERIKSPRHQTPRTRVPVGSVGIAGKQTGIYPQQSPGGWQLIGRTPIKVFDKQKLNPCLFSVGDTVKFVAINKMEFNALNEHSNT